MPLRWYIEKLQKIHHLYAFNRTRQCTENARECYNSTIDEDDDPRNINILGSEGSCTVVGPILECPEITEKLKIKKVNIGTEETLKIASIGNYWDDKTIGQIDDLLQEY